MEQLSKAEKTENESPMLGFMVDTLSDLAKNYDGQGLPAEAEKYYRQALDKQRQRVSLEKKGDERIAEIETALAQTLKAQNKYSESLNSFGQAVKYSYGQKTEDPRPLITSLEAISQILQKQGETEKIEQSYKEALSACADNEAVKNAIAVSLMSQAGNQYSAAAAEETPREAIKHFKVAERLISLAFSASATVPNSANENFQSAITTIIDTKIAGSEGDATVETESFLKDLLDMKLQSSSNGDRRGLRSVEQVISALERFYRNRDETKLVALYQNALTIRTRLYKGTDNQGVYNAHNELGRLYLRLGKYDEAKAHYKTALEIVERVSISRKTTSGLVVDSLLNLANVHVTVKEFAEAEQLYLRAKTNLEANKRDKSLKMAEVLTAYAGVLEKMGRLSEATKLQRDALDIRGKLSMANQGPEKQ
jgi:tetratricopeptide (TPR) repeat protein